MDLSHALQSQTTTIGYPVISFQVFPARVFFFFSKKKKTSRNPHYYLSLGYKSLLRRRHSFPRDILSACFYFLSFFQKCNNYVLTPTTDEDPWWHAFSTVCKKMYVTYSAIMILFFKSIIAIIHFLG